MRVRYKKCSFNKCPSSQQFINDKHRYFNFPSTDLADKWIEICKNKKLKSYTKKVLSRNFYLCDEHFKTSDYSMTLFPFKSTSKLRPGTIPIPLEKETSYNEDEFPDDPDQTEVEVIPPVQKPEREPSRKPITDVPNDLSKIHVNFISAEKGDDTIERKLEKIVAEDSRRRSIQFGFVNKDSDVERPSIKQEKLLEEVAKEEYFLMEETPIERPVMVSEGTQCDLMDDNEENNMNIFCCTFRSKNEVETFCHLSNTEVPLIQKPLHLDKNPKAKKSKTEKKPKEFLKISEVDNLKRNEENGTDHLIGSEGIIVNISDIHHENHSDSEDVIYTEDIDSAEVELKTRLKEKPTIEIKKEQKIKVKKKKVKAPLPQDLCKFCKNLFDKSLCQRIAAHFDDKFYCKYCNVNYDNLVDLNLHVKDHHPEMFQPIQCEYCNRKFSCEVSKSRHTRLWKCRVCNEFFNCQVLLRSHKNKNHGSLVTYNCGQCSITFKRKAKLTNHNKAIKCSLCDDMFTCLTVMRRHSQDAHRNICPVCNKVCKNYSTCRRHMRSHADPDKKFICDICSKGFSFKLTLTNHLRIHTGERPFLCDTCGATFSQSGALYTHVHGVHGVIKNIIGADGSPQPHLVKRKHKMVSKSNPNINRESKAKRPTIVVHVADKIM